MERLTTKKHQLKITSSKPLPDIMRCVSKLGQLEDLIEKHEISSVEELDRELEKIEVLRLLVKNLQDSNFLKRQELDKYHELEKELGIDLITLFKALRDGIYDKQQNHYYPYTNGKLLIWEEHNEIYTCWNIKDYGITWSLVKEDLEK